MSDEGRVDKIKRGYNILVENKVRIDRYAEKAGLLPSEALDVIIRKGFSELGCKLTVDDYQEIAKRVKENADKRKAKRESSRKDQ